MNLIDLIKNGGRIFNKRGVLARKTHTPLYSSKEKQAFKGELRAISEAGRVPTKDDLLQTMQTTQTRSVLLVKIIFTIFHIEFYVSHLLGCIINTKVYIIIKYFKISRLHCRLQGRIAGGLWKVERVICKGCRYYYQ